MNINDMFFSRAELEVMKFKSLGENVLIDRLTPIYKPEKISIGSNVRIGSFCILSGDITIGDYVHIASYCFLNGTAEIELEAFSGMSAYSRIITSSSDYSGNFLANPTVPESLRKDDSQKIILKKHALMGSGALLLPGASLEIGTVLGAMSMLTKPTKPFGIYFGNPARYIGTRERNILALEEKLLSEVSYAPKRARNIFYTQRVGINEF